MARCLATGQFMNPPPRCILARKSFIALDLLNNSIIGFDVRHLKDGLKNFFVNMNTYTILQ